MNQLEFAFNWTYADNRDIAYFSSGRLPIRPAGVDLGLPTNGDGDYEWQGFEPQKAHPQAIDPAGGVIVNWNNKPARSPSPTTTGPPTARRSGAVAGARAGGEKAHAHVGRGGHEPGSDAGLPRGDGAPGDLGGARWEHGAEPPATRRCCSCWRAGGPRAGAGST
jgi:hypothetical protein